MVQISFAHASQAQKNSDTLVAHVVGVYQNLELTPEAKALPNAKDIASLLKDLKFTGKESEFKVLNVSNNGKTEQLVIVGLGDSKQTDPLAYTKIGAALEAFLSNIKVTHAILDFSSLCHGSEDGLLLSLLHGLQLKNWRFEKYFTQKNSDTKIKLEHVVCVCPNPDTMTAKFADYEALMQGVAFAKTLISEPANVIYPETLAEHARSLEKDGVKVEILDVPAMKALGMNALLGVGQGSANPARLIVVKWNGHSDPSRQPIAIAGKGVTFDTGGISIKPSSGMDAMKTDMSGGAVVLGLVKALALRKAPVNVVGVVGAVENMPSGTAQRPGDVVTSMSGQTIEVLDTDAEGRLVLADVLWYTQKTFNPTEIVNLATLTGAIQITFGTHHAGLFSNNDALSEQLLAAGLKTGEKLWRLPLSDDYDKEIDSDIADMKNLGAPRSAGSIAAAQFLQRFVNKKPWAHLDIAGVSWLSKDTPLSRKGATGFGVRLLNRWIQDHHEHQVK